MFGWGTIAAAAAVGYLHQQYDFIKTPEQEPWWVMPIVSALAALLLVAIIQALFIAPYRAWRMLHPFKISVASGYIDSEYPTEMFPRQVVALTVRNMSYRQWSSCVLHILQIKNFDNTHHSLPRMVSEFSVLPGEFQRITFLSWTTRSPPHTNDQSFVLSGPVGWGLGGNVVALQCASQDIDIRIGVPDAEAIVIQCRVWTEGSELKAELRK